MTDPVSNIQIEDVLASIRKLVSEEVRAQTRAEEARLRGEAAQAGARAPIDAPAETPVETPVAEAPVTAQPAAEAPAVEKLVLSPHLRVAEDDDLGDQLYDAPFEADATFAEEAEVFTFRPQAAAPVAEAVEDAQDEDDLGIDAVIAALSNELSDEPQQETDWSLPQQDETPDNFGDWGDGAAEALASAQFAKGTATGARSDEVEDAEFDELDAVLSKLDFDPAPEPEEELDSFLSEPETESFAGSFEDETFEDAAGADTSFAPEPEEPEPEEPEPEEPEIEDAEILEESSAADTFERLFRQDAGQVAEVEVEQEVAITEVEEDSLDAFLEPETEEEDLAETSFAAEPDMDFAPEPDLDDTPEEEAPAENIEVADAAERDDEPAGHSLAQAAEFSPEATASGDDQGLMLDEAMLRDLVSEIIRQELQGALGERITRNVRKLVRREIQRALQSQDYI